MKTQTLMDEGMKIGNGKLELAIIGACDGIKGFAELESLVRETLNFYPLGDIFNLLCIFKDDKPGPFGYLKNAEDIAKKIKAIINPKVVVIIDDRRLYSRYDINSEIVYSKSKSDPVILAHELGHSLNLEHPLSECNLHIGCKPYSCLYRDYIMCCEIGMLHPSERRERIKSFSLEDIEKLERQYLGMEALST